MMYEDEDKAVDVIKYRELSGDTNPYTPISRIFGYLDGYKKALEQQPKTGHWILVSDGTPGGYWKCSECLMHKRMPGRLDSFCSCCGADMQESEVQE